MRRQRNSLRPRLLLRWYFARFYGKRFKLLIYIAKLSKNCLATNQGVVGSNPAGRASNSKSHLWVAFSFIAP